MKRSLTILLLSTATCLMLGAAGCRTAHLGANHGSATREALDAQRLGNKKSEPSALSAEDARQVLQVHRGADSRGATGSAARPRVISSSSSGSLSTGKWQGASGAIQLEAK